MTPYVILENLIPPDVIVDFNTVCNFVKNLPDPTQETAPAAPTRKHLDSDDFKALWTCHGITRGVRPLLLNNWEVMDGWFLRQGTEHSWLYLNHDQKGRKKFIIDVYPYACMGGPILLDMSLGSPWRDAYIERRMHYAPVEFDAFNAEGRDANSLYLQHLVEHTENN